MCLLCTSDASSRKGKVVALQAQSKEGVSGMIIFLSTIPHTIWNPLRSSSSQKDCCGSRLRYWGICFVCSSVFFFNWLFPIPEIILVCFFTHSNTYLLNERFYCSVFLSALALNIKTADFINYNVSETLPILMTLLQRLQPDTYWIIMAQVMHSSDGLC